MLRCIEEHLGAPNMDGVPVENFVKYSDIFPFFLDIFHFMFYIFMYSSMYLCDFLGIFGRVAYGEVLFIPSFLFFYVI